MIEVVAAARSSLVGGEHRFVESTCLLRNAWFPVNVNPSVAEELFSDRGVLHWDNPISKEFHEEVNAILAAIASRSDSRSLDQIQAEDGKQAMLMAASERARRRSMALALWDWHGAAVRLRGDFVFRVVSPRDLMGDPIIRSYPANRYVAEVAVRTAELDQQLNLASRSLVRWQIASAVLFVLLLLMIWLWARQ